MQDVSFIANALIVIIILAPNKANGIFSAQNMEFAA